MHEAVVIVTVFVGLVTGPVEVEAEAMGRFAAAPGSVAGASVGPVLLVVRTGALELGRVEAQARQRAGARGPAEHAPRVPPHGAAGGLALGRVEPTVPVAVEPLDDRSRLEARTGPSRSGSALKPPAGSAWPSGVVRMGNLNRFT